MMCKTCCFRILSWVDFHSLRDAFTVLGFIYGGRRFLIWGQEKKTTLIQRFSLTLHMMNKCEDSKALGCSRGPVSITRECKRSCGWYVAPLSAQSPGLSQSGDTPLPVSSLYRSLCSVSCRTWRNCENHPGRPLTMLFSSSRAPLISPLAAISALIWKTGQQVDNEHEL